MVHMSGQQVNRSAYLLSETVVKDNFNNSAEKNKFLVRPYLFID